MCPLLPNQAKNGQIKSQLRACHADWVQIYELKLKLAKKQEKISCKGIKGMQPEPIV